MTREEAINEIKSWDFLDEREIEAIQTLIPELEENEDEKIIMTINNILPFIHDEAYTNNGTTKKDVLNWLEKQKEYVADNRKASTSYDDRIRKAIIKSIEEDSSVYEQEVSKKQMIAYLEKQKDTDKAIEAVDRIDKYIDEHLANAHDMKDSNPDKKYYRGWDDALGKMAGILQDVYSNEKQKEQKHYWKPTETDVALFNKAVTTNNTLTPAERANLDIIRSKFSCCRAINCSGIMQKEQKPTECADDVVEEAEEYTSKVACGEYGVEVTEAYIAGVLSERNRGTEWSEEDKQWLESIIKDYEDNLTKDKDHAAVIKIKIDFLKSLRLKSHSEWRHYIWTTNLRFDFTALIKYDNTDNYEIVQAGNRPKQEKNGVYILIKDIKPQPSWKPSEKQMEALNALNLHGDLSYVGQQNQLISLYQDLKKLM